MADNNDDGPILYGAYAQDLVRKGIIQGDLPVVSTNPNLLEEQAKGTMTKWKLIPRVLKPTNPRDLSVTLFGEKYDTPVLMAPVGVNSLFHADKEIGVASACAALRVPFTLSTAASTSMEELVKAVPGSPKWFQLYWPGDDEITVSPLKRAKDNGFKVLVVTLDTWTLAWRPNDLDTANLPFIVGEGDANGFSDPVFRRKFAERTDGGTPEENKLQAGIYWTSEAFPGFTRGWEDLKFLKEHWDGPIVLKGILSIEDAVLAADHGMDGIIVSNHGGRQIDGSFGTLDVLPEIVDAVGDKLTVMIDSGFRTGADIVKALALGAKGVFVGRPVVYGLGINGQAGAEAVLAGLLADLDLTMGFIGTKSIADLRRSILRKIQHSGDVKSNL
ncbi:FMN-dependent alpha-hydroxy acid dehydrogenase PB1A11.03 [Cladobotryum mycophilum]|uniref:FMN-dependent alpha-hydroxy acid dehydrogenase PB1A11.03 n=1 Tax=Cladobotryum mycophilum TaxID=491253 RepID=A0ABR0SES4_9HYPO